MTIKKTATAFIIPSTVGIILIATTTAYAERDRPIYTSCSTPNVTITSHQEIIWETGSRDPTLHHGGYSATATITIPTTRYEQYCSKQVWKETEVKCAGGDKNFADFAIDCEWIPAHLMEVTEDCSIYVDKVYASLHSNSNGGSYRIQSIAADDGKGNRNVFLPSGFAGLPKTICVSSLRPIERPGPSH